MVYCQVVATMVWGLVPSPKSVVATGHERYHVLSNGIELMLRKRMSWIQGPTRPTEPKTETECRQPSAPKQRWSMELSCRRGP